MSAALVSALHAALTEDDRELLLSVVSGQPDWNRLPLPGVPDLPAVRWKLHNVARMTPGKRREAARALRQVLWPDEG